MVITRFACTRKRNIRAGNTARHWKIRTSRKLGEAYGALGLKVTRDEEFMPAMKKAMAANGSALIEVLTDYEFVTPTATLSELAGKTLAGRVANNLESRTNCNVARMLSVTYQEVLPRFPLKNEFDIASQSF